jgi:hypothetical protein
VKGSDVGAKRSFRKIPVTCSARARAVEVFQRLNALDPAAVAAEDLTPEGWSIL